MLDQGKAGITNSKRNSELLQVLSSPPFLVLRMLIFFRSFNNSGRCAAIRTLFIPLHVVVYSIINLLPRNTDSAECNFIQQYTSGLDPNTFCSSAQLCTYAKNGFRHHQQSFLESIECSGLTKRVNSLSHTHDLYIVYILS